MKKLRQDGKRRHDAGSGAVAAAGHDAKRPRHGAPGAGPSLEPHHHRNGQQSYDGRCGPSRTRPRIITPEMIHVKHYVQQEKHYVHRNGQQSYDGRCGPSRAKPRLVKRP